MIRILTASVATVVAMATVLGAQQDTLVSLRGRVRAEVDSSPLPSVTVRIPELARQVSSGGDGRFALERVPRGRWRVEARREGFAALDTTVDLVAAGIALELVLRPAAQQLEGVTVSASGAAEPRSAALAEFEARRSRGLGKYITAAELRVADNRTVPDVLRARMPGLALELGSAGVHAYNLNQQPPGALKGNAGRKCYVQIVVDGVAVYQMGSGSMPDDTRPPNLNEFTTRELDGVEYYSNPGRTPPEFRTTGAICGTLVLWSRRR